MCKLRCCPVRDGFKVGRPIHRRCKLDEPRARLEGVWLGGGAAVTAAQRMTGFAAPAAISPAPSRVTPSMTIGVSAPWRGGGAMHSAAKSAHRSERGEANNLHGCT